MGYVVDAKWVAKEWLEADVAGALERLQAASLQEPGCREYRVHREVDAPRSFLLYEVYDDPAAYQAHLESPHFREHALEYGIPQLETRERQFYEVVT
jgi:quinol monooxygenase YgiN